MIISLMLNDADNTVYKVGSPVFSSFIKSIDLINNVFEIRFRETTLVIYIPFHSVLLWRTDE